MMSNDQTLDILHRVISDLLEKVIIQQSGLFSIYKKKNRKSDTIKVNAKQ